MSRPQASGTCHVRRASFRERLDRRSLAVPPSGQQRCCTAERPRGPSLCTFRTFLQIRRLASKMQQLIPCLACLCLELRPRIHSTAQLKRHECDIVPKKRNLNTIHRSLIHPSLCPALKLLAHVMFGEPHFASGWTAAPSQCRRADSKNAAPPRGQEGPHCVTFLQIRRLASKMQQLMHVSRACAWNCALVSIAPHS